MKGPVLSWRMSAVIGAVFYRASTVLSGLILSISYGPGNFSTVVILMVYTPLITLLSSLGLDQALFREVLAGGNGRVSRHRIRKIMLSISTTLPASLFIGIVTSVLFGFDVLIFVCASVLGLLTAVSFNQVSAYMRALQRSRVYLLSMASIAVVMVVARAVGSIVGLEAGWAWLLGDLFAVVCWSSITLVWYTRSATGRTRASIFRMAEYGVPLTFHGLFQWVLGSADRFIFATAVSPVALGTYGAVYQFAGGFNAAASEINKTGLHRYPGAGPVQVRTAMVRDGKILGLLWIVGVFPLSGVLYYLNNAEYPGSLELGLLLYISFLPLIFYLPMANNLSVRMGKSRILAVSSMLGASVNVLVNLLLVQKIGTHAGPVANFLGYLTMMLFIVMPTLRPERGYGVQ